MIIKTTQIEDIQPFLNNFFIPSVDSHKGQNGKVFIIGGSELFHAASIWAAETASHFVDMVHYSSTQENNEIMTSLKKQFHNGIVVHQKDIPYYVKEDDAILVGPGMVRSEEVSTKSEVRSFEEVLNIQDEGEFTRQLTYYLIHTFPEKRFVLDAGALQMMNPEWLLALKEKPILTPHQLEFERLFGISIKDLPLEKKIEAVQAVAKKYNVVVLLKAISDIITDGDEVYVVEGGNQGLTKGGTGDTLAGLIVSLYTKNDPITSAVLASYLLKKSADVLSETKGYWYNIDDLIQTVPETLKKLLIHKIT